MYNKKNTVYNNTSDWQSVWLQQYISPYKSFAHPRPHVLVGWGCSGKNMLIETKGCIYDTKGCMYWENFIANILLLVKWIKQLRKFYLTLRHCHWMVLPTIVGVVNCWFGSGSNSCHYLTPKCIFSPVALNWWKLCLVLFFKIHCYFLILCLLYFFVASYCTQIYCSTE